MRTESATLVEHDQFQKAPALFKYGPWGILVAALVVSVATALAVQHRQVENRKAEYEKAFVTTQTTATAAAEIYSLLTERLWQASGQVDALQTGSASLAGIAQSGLGLADLEVTSFAVMASGQLVALGSVPVETEGRAREGLAMAKVVPLSVQSGKFFPVHAPGARHWTAVVHHLSGDGAVRAVLHLVPPETMARVGEHSLASLRGIVTVQDFEGSVLFAASNFDGQLKEDSGFGMRDRDVANSVREAMAAELDFDSQRLLVTQGVREGRGFYVSVGLRESDALMEYRERYAITWRILGIALACWMGMAMLVSWALNKFKRTEEYLRTVATTDILTGLPNRRSFQTLLSKAVKASAQRKDPLALFFLDLDNFKYVNDSMGHPVGDSLLQHVGKLLQESLRPGDHVCRLAGDEFTVLVRGVDCPRTALQVGERMLRQLRTMFACNGVEIEPKASMGVALMPMHATSETDMMRFADTALYRAKLEGKGRCVVYDESMAAQALAKAQTVRDLERGIAHDELFLVYQPKYHLASGTLTGHEALVRWMHPVRGQVFPNDFIPLAEESGLIADVGNWVLRRAVRQIHEWHAQGKGWHKVAVNVSPLQLKNASFVELVERVLAEHKVPGRFLQVELTESSLAADANRARALVHELRRLGVTVAVDDFGTGYSSLSTLSQFEIDTLKVDRSFINTILTKEGESICRAIISLGHSLEMSIVAEGVETSEQAMALAYLGCNEVQGYLYSKPVPADVSVTLMRVTPSVPPLEEPAARSEEPESSARSHLVAVK